MCKNVDRCTKNLIRYVQFVKVNAGKTNCKVVILKENTYR